MSTERQPAYLRLADDLRRQILDGTLAPGARLPSRKELARQHGVAESVALQAQRLLTAEGFVHSVPGSGTYVRSRPEHKRLVRSWYREHRGGSPWRAEMAAANSVGSWKAHSATETATPTVAERLRLAAGDAVMRTEYVFVADEERVFLSTSWEPLSITGSTPILFPEEGPYAGAGVVERFAAIGVKIHTASERVRARPALASEAETLDIPAGVPVIAIARTYYSDDRPVETADIVVPSHRYEVEYLIPVDDDGPHQ